MVPVWRYDPERGGVYQDEEDPLAMPGALPPVFEQGPAGAAPVSPGVASSAAMAGVPTLEPVTVTAESNRTERAIPTANEAPLAKREEDALTERGKVTEKQADVAGRQKDTEAETQEKLAKNEEERGRLKLEAQQKTAEYMGRLRQQADELEAEGANQEKGILGGWQKSTTGEKIVAGLAVLVSAIGQGLTGQHGPNQALGIIMGNWKQDREEAKAAIRRDFFDRAKGLRGPALEQAKEELELKLHGVDAKYDGLAKQIVSTGAALTARTGRDDVKLKMEELMAVEQQKLAADKLKREESLREKKSHEFESKQVIPGGGASLAQDKRIFGNKGDTVAIAPDVDTAHVLRTKVAAYQQIRALTKRLEKADVNAPLGSAAREQIQRDLDALGTAQAIINNNDGKPSDADTRAGKEEAGTTWAMGTRAKIAKATGREGIDPRTGWAVIGARAREKLEAEFKAKIPGADRLPDAIDRVDYVPPGATKGPGGGPPRSPAPAPKAPAKPAATQETKQLRDKKTGRVFTGYKHRDGQFYETPETP